MEEVILNGKMLSSGDGLGVIFCYFSSPLLETEVSVSNNHVSKEIARYRRALRSSREELFGLQKKLKKEGSQEAYKIIDVQMQLLKDPFIEGVVSTIKKTKINAYAALCKLYHNFAKQIVINRESPAAQETLIDVKDLSERILFHLHPNKKKKVTVPKDAILVVEEMTPSLVASFDKMQLKAIITTRGALTSHGVIIAQSKKIPIISGISMEQCSDYHGKTAFVDGGSSQVVINPKPERINKVITPSSKITSKQQPVNGGDCFIVNTKEDIAILNEKPSIDVGLVRTECLFENPFEVSIASQIECYEQILDNAGGFVNFRLFDLTEDKVNPKVKWRLKNHCSLRFLLSEQAILKRQLKALLSLNHLERVRICIPFVTFVEEVIQIKKIISEIASSNVVSLGCMVETPSGALISEKLSEQVQFFCVGTNDLSHLVLGTNRLEELPVQDAHVIPESLEFLLKLVHQSAMNHSTEVIVCGEYTTSQEKVHLLRKWGFKQFAYSLSANHVFQESI